MSSTDHKAPYVVLSTPLLPRPSWAQIISSTPYFKTPSTQQINYCHKNNFTETNLYLILTILNKTILIEHKFSPRVLWAVKYKWILPPDKHQIVARKLERVKQKGGGGRGGTVVKVTAIQIESRWCHWNFSLT
jgi:hypothetical protein